MRARWDPLVAECKAALYGLKKAKDFGLSQVLLESDSLSMVSRLRKNSMSLTHDIIFASSSFIFVDWLHVKRDGNYVANHLAKLVPVGVEQCWEHHSPDEVSPYVLLGYSDNSKSVEYMPFGLSFVLFLTGGVWTIYTVLVHDYFLGVPNGIGFIFGAIQLVVYCIYRNYKGLPKSLEESIEEGTTHEPLLH